MGFGAAQNRIKGSVVYFKVISPKPWWQGERGLDGAVCGEPRLAAVAGALTTNNRWETVLDTALSLGKAPLNQLTLWPQQGRADLQQSPDR
ncbi:hypothetical protein NDU88_005182 [Pleurodeles waltl]|uniref:Uncharacterized protein n=1 Tax=Pleurodeles waltl TaxID=8319 RepID=A0AAV7L336_PLEWA|nr:hypothetical protein NDU88_005182 [Pleurodeles waltl]